MWAAAAGCTGAPDTADGDDVHAPGGPGRPECHRPFLRFPSDEGTREDANFVPGDPLIVYNVSEGRFAIGDEDAAPFPPLELWLREVTPGPGVNGSGFSFFFPNVAEPCQSMRVEIQSQDCANLHEPPSQLVRQVSCIGTASSDEVERASASVTMSGNKLAWQAFLHEEIPAGQDLPPGWYTLHAEASFDPGPADALPALSVSFDPTHAITWPADEVQTAPTGWLHGPPRAGELQIDGLPFRVTHLEAHAFVDAGLRLPRFAFWGRGSVEDYWAIRTAADPTVGDEPNVQIQPCELDGGCFDFVWHSDVLADVNLHTDFRRGFEPE